MLCYYWKQVFTHLNQKNDFKKQSKQIKHFKKDQSKKNILKRIKADTESIASIHNHNKDQNKH